MLRFHFNFVDKLQSELKIFTSQKIKKNTFLQFGGNIEKLMFYYMCLPSHHSSYVVVVSQEDKTSFLI